MICLNFKLKPGEFLVISGRKNQDLYALENLPNDGQPHISEK